MLIRPQMCVDNFVGGYEQNRGVKQNKNTIYLYKIDDDKTPIGKNIVYDVILISEILSNEIYLKLIHYYTGIIYPNMQDKENDVLDKMVLYPVVSTVSEYKKWIKFEDSIGPNNISYNDLGYAAIVKYDSKDNVRSCVFYDRRPFIFKERFKHTESDIIKLKAKTAVQDHYDICDPLNPRIKIIKDGEYPECILNKPAFGKYYGKEFKVLKNLVINDVYVDYEKERKENIERNKSYRMLLSSGIDEVNTELMKRVDMSILARKIMTDYCKIDLLSCIESVIIIFDSKTREVGFKSCVSPFGEVYHDFIDEEVSMITDNFKKLCIYNLCDNLNKYRITISVNQYEMTCKITELTESMLKSNNTITVKMSKSEAMLDFATQRIITQEAIKNL